MNKFYEEAKKHKVHRRSSEPYDYGVGEMHRKSEEETKIRELDNQREEIIESAKFARPFEKMREDVRGAFDELVYILINNGKEQRQRLLDSREATVKDIKAFNERPLVKKYARTIDQDTVIVNDKWIDNTMKTFLGVVEKNIPEKLERLFDWRNKEERKEFYKDLAKQYHPDKHGGSSRYDVVFRIIKDVYDSLIEK
jgi:hypothetical protein